MKFRIVFPISFCPMGRPQQSRPVQWVVFSRLMERIPRYCQRLHQISLKVQIIIEATNHFSMIACFLTDFHIQKSMVKEKSKLQWYCAQITLPSPYSQIFVNNETFEYFFHNLRETQPFLVKVWVSRKWKKRTQTKLPHSKKLLHSKKYSKKEMHSLKYSKKYS